MASSAQPPQDLTWLVFGASGFIGEQLVARLRAAGQRVEVSDARIRAYADALAAVREHRPDRVVCSVGRTHSATCATVDALEGPDCWADAALANHHVPVWLAQACEARDASPAVPLLYVGTGCIYSDASERVFAEDDAPNFFGSTYSRIKAMTDAVLAQQRHVLVARIRMPVADDDGPRDFVCKLLSYPTICVDGKNSLSVLGDVLPAMLAMSHRAVGGVFNVVNPGPLDHREVLSVFREVAGRCHRHTVVTDPQELRLRSARSCCRLSSDKLQARLAELPADLRALYGCPAALPTAAESLARVALHRRGGARSLLVTGGCGFIGSGFVNDWLRRYAADAIVNVDCLAPECGARRDHVEADDPSSPDASRYAFAQLDLASEGAETELADLMRRHRVDLIVHLAARTHVDESFDGAMSLEYTRSNVVGTHRLLEAARRYRDATGALRLFLHISTDEIWGGDSDRVHAAGANEETGVLRPSNPYAATKAAAEMVVASYHLSHRMPCVIARFNNVYGARQHVTKVIPRFSTLALQGRPLPLHGGGTALRAFLHVTDVARAIAVIVQSGAIGESYNVGSGTELTIARLAAKICSLAAADLLVETVEDRPFQDRRYLMDDAKLRALGWRPLVDFDAGLAQTFAWYAARSIAA